MPTTRRTKGHGDLLSWHCRQYWRNTRANRGPEVKAMKIWKRVLSGYQSPMLTRSDCGQEEDEGWNKGNTRCRNAREPLLRIASDPILHDLLVVETGADRECEKEGEGGEGCVGDGDPAGGERDGRKLAVWHGREGKAWRTVAPTASLYRRQVLPEHSAVVGTRSTQRKRQATLYSVDSFRSF